MTTGEVPDICYVDHGDFLLIPQSAWNGKLVDVSDVVETQKGEYSQTALTAALLLRQRRARSAAITACR